MQGNARLATMTSRTAFLGFLLAFVIGALNPEVGIPTEEMDARHWPSLVDVAIVFASSLVLWGVGFHRRSEFRATPESSLEA